MSILIHIIVHQNQIAMNNTRATYKNFMNVFFQIFPDNVVNNVIKDKQYIINDQTAFNELFSNK